VDCPGFWPWVERLSWFLTIVGVVVGLPIGIYQLVAVRREQKRIANELERKAEIVVGFPVEDVPASAFPAEVAPVSSTEIAPHWEPGQGKMSQPVLLTMHTLNRGTRTARQLLLNFLFPKNLQPRTWAGAPEGQEITQDPDGTIRLIAIAKDLHPGTGHVAGTLLLVPNDLAEFDVVGSVNIEDTKPQKFQLKVKVKGAVVAKG